MRKMEEGMDYELDETIPSPIITKTQVSIPSRQECTARCCVDNLY